MTDSARGTSRFGTGTYPIDTAPDSTMVCAITRADEQVSIDLGPEAPDPGDAVIVVDPRTDLATRYTERPGARGHRVVPIDLNPPTTDTDKD